MDKDAVFLKQILLNVWNQNFDFSDVSAEKITELTNFALKNIHYPFTGLQICNFLNKTINENDIFYND